jgi:hypothetical protein
MIDARRAPKPWMAAQLTIDPHALFKFAFTFVSFVSFVVKASGFCSDGICVWRVEAF